MNVAAPSSPSSSPKQPPESLGQSTEEQVESWANWPEMVVLTNAVSVILAKNLRGSEGKMLLFREAELDLWAALNAIRVARPARGPDETADAYISAVAAVLQSKERNSNDRTIVERNLELSLRAAFNTRPDAAVHDISALIHAVNAILTLSEHDTHGQVFLDQETELELLTVFKATSAMRPVEFDEKIDAFIRAVSAVVHSKARTSRGSLSVDFNRVLALKEALDAVV